MSEQVEGFERSRLFFDDANFPHGFNKSGDFTIKESQLLSSYGSLLQDLHVGKCSANNQIQERFVEVCQGLAAPESPMEKVWMKYLDKSNRKSMIPRMRFSANDALVVGYIDDVDLELDM